MKFEEHESEWAADCAIDNNNLHREALKIPQLHAKWTKRLNDERRSLHAYKLKMQELENVLEGYYSRTLTMQEMEKFGMPELPDKKVLKPDMARTISSDKKMIEMKLRVGQQSDKVDYLADIVKAVHGRAFIIRDAIEWNKFQAGS